MGKVIETSLFISRCWDAPALVNGTGWQRPWTPGTWKSSDLKDMRPSIGSRIKTCDPLILLLILFTFLFTFLKSLYIFVLVTALPQKRFASLFKNTKHGSRSRAHTRSILHDPYPDPYPMILRDPYPRSIPLIHTLDPYPFLVEERLMLALMLLFILILLLVLVLLLPLLLPLFLLLPPLPPLAASLRCLRCLRCLRAAAAATTSHLPPRSCCYCCRFCCCSCWSCSRCWCWFTSSVCFW